MARNLTFPSTNNATLTGGNNLNLFTLAIRLTKGGTHRVYGAQAAGTGGGFDLDPQAPERNLCLPSANNLTTRLGQNLIWTLNSYTRRTAGRSGVYGTQAARQAGRFDSIQAFARGMAGRTRVGFDKFEGRRACGLYRLYNTGAAAQAGRAGLQGPTAARRAGVTTIFETYPGIARTGQFNLASKVTAKRRGRTRIEQAAAEGYAVYVGYDGPPDFTQDPDGFGAALPVAFAVVTPTSPATTDLHVVLRKVNRYGVESQNQKAEVITIDSNGDEVLGALTPPEILDATPGEDEGFLLYLSYPGKNSDANPADSYRVYVKKGSAPVPGVDSPVATGVATTQATAKVGPYPVGDDTYHIAVTMYRDADAEESTADTTTIVLGPDPETPVPLWGGYAV